MSAAISGMRDDACGSVLEGVPGLSFNRDGMVGLSGSLLALAQRIDAAFSGLARVMGAEAHDFVPVLAASDLRRVDYFASFPQLATIPVTLARDDENLREFARRNGRHAEGSLTLAELAPATALLPPAACYAIYASLREQNLASPRTLTTLGTCYRREQHYLPLRRQWCFRMREIVHLGTAESVEGFLEEARDQSVALARELGVSYTLRTATDPFFDPASSAKHLHQRLFPTKQELVTADGLAIGSLNRHRNFFGEAFGLRFGGTLAHSACLAFGLERWLYAVLAAHGRDPRSWPGGAE
jgi:hypothetical protein